MKKKRTEMANPRPGTQWGDTMSPDGENRRLYIGNIPKICTLQDLRDKFAKYGTIEGISIKLGYAFLQFRRPNEQIQAILEDRTKLLGSTIQVRAYRSDKPPPGGDKSKSIKRDRSRSPPPSRNSTSFDDWTNPMPNDVPAPGHMSSSFEQIDNNFSHEVEVIVYEPNPDVTQKRYAEIIKDKIENETNISAVGIIHRRATEELTIMLNDLYREKTLYAIIISPLDPVNLSATLYLIRDTSAPKYSNLDELIQFMKEDYQTTYRGKPPSFRYEQFARTNVGFSATPQQLTQQSSQFYTRHPPTNMQARLGGYKVEESNQPFREQPAEASLSRNDTSANSSNFNDMQNATQHMRTELKPNSISQPENYASRQQSETVKIKDEKMPRDVELSLGLILEQGNCRSLSDIQLESIVDYFKSQKVANQNQGLTNSRSQIDQETKSSFKNNAPATRTAPIANAFNILAKSGIGSNHTNFTDSTRREPIVTSAHIKEEQSDEPLIIQEKIANKPNQQIISNQALNTLNSSNINSVLDSAFDVLQKSGISVRNANNNANNNINQNNGTPSAGLFVNSSFQRRHPLNGTQIYPDQAQGSAFHGRF